MPGRLLVNRQLFCQGYSDVIFKKWAQISCWKIVTGLGAIRFLEYGYDYLSDVW